MGEGPGGKISQGEVNHLSPMSIYVSIFKIIHEYVKKIYAISFLFSIFYEMEGVNLNYVHYKAIYHPPP